MGKHTSPSPQKSSLTKPTRRARPQKPTQVAETEINERAPKHLFEGTRPLNEAEGLPFEDLPRHLASPVGDDENELDAALARKGAGDEGPSRDEEALDASISEGLWQQRH
jgi:hypothetical protein